MSACKSEEEGTGAELVFSERFSSMAAHGQAVELGEGLWGLAFYAISDAFGLIRHVPHVVVIASGGNEDL